MVAPSVRVCLIFHSTRSDNLGVGALTVSEIRILRDIARESGRRIAITVMDWKDRRTPYVAGDDIRIVDLDGRTILNPFGYLREVLRSDIVIDIGGGDSFADIYGSARLNRMFALKFIAHLAGRPVVVAPQTIGPFHRPVSALLARLTLRLSRIVATRDRLSTQAVRDLGLDRPVIEASDVALRLPFEPMPRRTDGPTRVGLNVSGLLMNGGYSGQNEFGLKADYPALIRGILHHFRNRPDGCELHLVPHVIVSEGRLVREDDLRACHGLADEFPGTIVAPAFASPPDAKSYISGMDFFMGARMHACIAAFSSGVPVVPMAYSRKFAGLFGSLGYDRTVDCTAQDNAAILDEIAAAYDKRSEIAAEIRERLAGGLQKLSAYEAALQGLIVSIP